jgi:hypothetical protein
VLGEDGSNILDSLLEDALAYLEIINESLDDFGI